MDLRTIVHGATGEGYVVKRFIGKGAQGRINDPRLFGS